MWWLVPLCIVIVALGIVVLWYTVVSICDPRRYFPRDIDGTFYRVPAWLRIGTGAGGLLAIVYATFDCIRAGAVGRASPIILLSGPLLAVLFAYGSRVLARGFVALTDTEVVYRRGERIKRIELARCDEVIHEVYALGIKTIDRQWLPLAPGTEYNFRLAGALRSAVADWKSKKTTKAAVRRGQRRD
jgi:hypothetical protein